jgi:G3E family GTPase
VQNSQSDSQKLPHRPIPVSVLVGFLGAGKTTVLNHILSAQHGRKIAVIVNEFGEANIDSALVRHTTEHMVEMSNGCICCTLREDLLNELTQLSATPGLEYIIIESTGLGEPLPIAQVFYMENMRDLVVLDSIITVVDAVNFWDQYRGEGTGEDENGQPTQMPFAPLLLDQIEFTNVVLLNKSDAVEADRLLALEGLLHTLNPSARVHRTVRGAIDPSLLIGTGLFEYSDGPVHEKWDTEWNKTGSESEEYGFSSFVYRRSQPFHYDQFVRFIEESWPQEVVRSKGFVKFSDSAPVVFQQAGYSITVEKLAESEPLDGEETDISFEDEADDGVAIEDMNTELVFIGCEMKRAAIEAALDACLDAAAITTSACT